MDRWVLQHLFGYTYKQEVLKIKMKMIQDEDDDWQTNLITLMKDGIVRLVQDEFMDLSPQWRVFFGGL